MPHVDRMRFGTSPQLPFVLGLAEALSDNKVEAVTVSESVPNRIGQEFARVFMDKGSLVLGGAVGSRSSLEEA